MASTTKKITNEDADLAVRFETGATLRVYGLDDNEKLVIRPKTDTKREKAIYGKDLVSVYTHTDGGREIVDWPLNDENATSEGFWTWVQRLLTNPDIQPKAIQPDE